MARKEREPCNSGTAARHNQRPMRAEPIRVESFVKVGGKDVNTRDLSDEQRRTLANWIKLTILNEVYRGQAVFSVKE